MKSTGIICEYNPFHNGHIHHLQESKKMFPEHCIVCVMSGNFVQRGECAISDKWERANCAVLNGADLVIELPFIYATQSANFFAYGAIELLKLAQVDAIVFGSESNDIKQLQNLADKDESLLSQYKEKDSATVKAYEQFYGTLNANDILGINYIKHLKDTNIDAYTIQRTNSYHDVTIKDTFASASAIRHALENNIDVKELTPMHIENPVFMKQYYPYLKTLLLTCDKDTMSQYFLMDEGIENLFIKNAKVASSYEDFLSLCISKRYTKSKIQRTILHFLSQTTKKSVNTLPKLTTLRVLAYNEKGKQYLSQLKKQEVKIASRFNQIPEPYKSMELKASHLYAYLLPLQAQESWLKKELQPPIYIKK